MNPLTATYLNRLSDLLFILGPAGQRRAATCSGSPAATAERRSLITGGRERA